MNYVLVLGAARDLDFQKDLDKLLHSDQLKSKLKFHTSYVYKKKEQGRQDEIIKMPNI
jgi:hypothetical protein